MIFDALLNLKFHIDSQVLSSCPCTHTDSASARRANSNNVLAALSWRKSSYAYRGFLLRIFGRGVASCQRQFQDAHASPASLAELAGAATALALVSGFLLAFQ